MAGRRSLLSPAALDDYIRDHTRAPDTVERAQHAATAELGGVATMRIDHEQAVLTTLLTQLAAPAVAVEVGTFTGASAMAIARGLPPDATLHCFDRSVDWTDVAQDFWEQAGVADRIRLHLGPADQGLAELPDEPHVGLAFIDADKPGYVGYHDAIVPRLVPGGLLLVDNVLWSGDVVDPEVDDDDTRAIRAYNDHAADDDRLEGVILPIGDGLFVLRRTDD
ncbi:O-methyltransferase [Salsipaludibacter albus]|uniref:O-methyltransferase n=1 Tax=Salsipaludibacter albus TaxID=2849650 RepID=UPI001EE47173|nr:O-methyltransferase [Salsipaludibacter albus]MBY5164173.1 O-methyltransferase [Salsipaludibacter albus]